jgi:RNA polymerase sigma-70 factor (ECF subfamily)
VSDDGGLKRFELLALPHLDAAYNLARWLTGNDADAQDVVQDAMLRAMRYFSSFRGDNARPWLLQVVRHTAYTWIKQNRPADMASLDDDGAVQDVAGPATDEPSVSAQRGDERAQLNLALAALPTVFREALVLRELEDLSYQEIARIADIPIGTVMSRLARARALMRQALAPDTRPQLRAVARTAPGGAKS